MPAIALDRTPAFEDTDRATRQTVEKMCELIRASISDPGTDSTLQTIAAQIKTALLLGLGRSRRARVRRLLVGEASHHVPIGRRHDAASGRTEPTRLAHPSGHPRTHEEPERRLRRLHDVGGRAADNPSRAGGDRNGCRRPRRSVALVACVSVRNSQSVPLRVVVPLDTSHGKAPGWMVPRSRINRWQTWTLDGRPADVQIPTYHGLNGYRTTGVGAARRLPFMVPRRGRAGFRGFGQACASSTCTDPTFDVNGNPDGGCNAWDDAGAPHRPPAAASVPIRLRRRLAILDGGLRTVSVTNAHPVRRMRAAASAQLPQV